ncbi:putative lipid II flippase FtsW [Candidatus Giovannonibacteria bacterium]|nr:putative lipid II flippase FtsW [Candidatus Giovannonibacteria bacterium]
MRADPVLKGVLWALALAGFFILASASIGLTARRDLPPYYFVLRQFLAGGLLGLGALAVTSGVNYRRWRSWAFWIFLFSFLLTLLVFAPKVGLEFGGAKRWIGFGPFNFQPSELLKFGYVLYLAALFSSERNEVKTFRGGLLPFILVSALIAAVFIAEPDVGSLGVSILAGFLLFIVAGARFKHILWLAVLGAVLFAVLAFFEPYRLDRIRVFLDSAYEPRGAGYQLNQSLIAVGSGGIFGRGFGMSRQKFQYLPEPMGDSIFAVAAEEFGFVGSVLLVGIFVVFAWRGFLVASEARDFFGRLLGSGIVILIVAQSLVNIAALVGLLPLTGIPLLFVSQGGSALAITLAEVGVLLNISKNRA